MAQIIHLEVRETHRYVGTHAHLDSWRDVGRAKVFPARLVREGNGYDDGGTYLMTAKIPAGQDPALSQRALADHFTRWGCSHEYDCCGCVSTRASVKRVTPRTFSVAVDYTRNY